MRLETSEECKNFKDWCQKIGNGDLQEVIIPENNFFQLKAKDDIKLFCQEIFKDINENISDLKWISERAILAPKYEDVNKLNSIIMDMIDGEEFIFRSADEFDNDKDKERFNVEYLNSLEPNGFPQHEIKFKKGTPII